MPNDTCRDGYCPVCGQTLDNDGRCLSRCTEKGGTHYVPPKRLENDLRKFSIILRGERNMSTPTPTTMQRATFITSLVIAIVKSGGNPEVAQDIIKDDDPFDKLINMCASNNIGFIYNGPKR